MTLRCRPGDVAFIVRTPPRVPQLFGVLCTVLYAAPVGVQHQLPDGTMNVPSRAESWVIELPWQVDMPRANEGTSRTRYAVCPDRCLRPIRPDAEPVRIERGEPVGAAA